MAKTPKHGCIDHRNVYWQSYDYNNTVYAGIFNLIENIALARFRWDGLPKTCDARYLERVLFRQGIATVSAPSKTAADAGAFFSLQCIQQGPPNMYGSPSKWRAMGDNGTSFKADGRTGWYCYDNMTRRPIVPLLEIYARELADIIRTQQIDRMHLKTPYLITAPKGMEQTVLNVLKQLLGGEPAVVGNDSLSNIDISVISTGTEFHGSELTAAEANVWNKIYAALGVPNLTYKAERQIEDEVRANTAPTDLMRLSPLQCRRTMADYLNDRFNLDVHPVWNVDFESDNHAATHDVNMAAKLYAGDLGNMGKLVKE